MRIRIPWLLSCIACSLLVASACLAADSAPAAPLAPIADELARSAGALVQLLVMVLAGLALNALRAKLGVDLAGASDARVRAWAAQAGSYAEELAAAKLRGELSGADKLVAAAGWLRARCPQLSDSEARELIIAALPFVGVGASAGALPQQPHQA